MKIVENLTCRFLAWPVAIDEKWKLVQVRRLASQSVSPDQMGVFVGSVPNDLPLPPALKWILKLKPAVEVDKVSRRENRNPNQQQKTTSSGKSFTSVQMFHTHTPSCRRAFVGRCTIAMRRSSDTVNWIRIVWSQGQRQEGEVQRTNEFALAKLAKPQLRRGTWCSQKCPRCPHSHQVERFEPTQLLW